jgi:hypothetical protein
LRQPRERLSALVKEPAARKFRPFGAGRRRNSTMPSLFRFLVFVGLIGGLGYVTVFALANFVRYHPREIVVTIPTDKFLKNR